MDFAKLDMEVRDPNNVNDHLKVKKVSYHYLISYIIHKSMFAYDK